MDRHIDILEKQERMLRFDHFTHKDILDLGMFMVNRSKSLNTCVSVAIRTADGAAVFQHLLCYIYGIIKRHLACDILRRIVFCIFVSPPSRDPVA